MTKGLTAEQVARTLADRTEAIAAERRDRFTFSARLADALEHSGLTAAALADRLDVDRSVVSRWLSGENWPTARALMRVCQALAVEPAALMKGLY